MSLVVESPSINVKVNDVDVPGARLGVEITPDAARWHVKLPFNVSKSDRVSVLFYEDGVAFAQRSVIVADNLLPWDPIEVSVPGAMPEPVDVHGDHIRMEIIGFIASTAVVANWNDRNCDRLWDAIVKIEELAHGA